MYWTANTGVYYCWELYEAVSHLSSKGITRRGAAPAPDELLNLHRTSYALLPFLVHDLQLHDSVQGCLRWFQNSDNSNQLFLRQCVNGLMIWAVMLCRLSSTADRLNVQMQFLLHLSEAKWKI